MTATLQNSTTALMKGRVSIMTGSQALGAGSSLAVSYPEDEVGTKETGAQWQLELDGEYEKAFLSYRVKFADGFDFSRGGKLPGLAGGTDPRVTLQPKETTVGRAD